MNNLHIWICASVVALTLAGTYIIWGPSNRPKKKKGAIPGLQNLGNSCFLNAVLQALAACPLFISWLFSVIIEMEAKEREHCVLIKALFSVLKALNRNEDECTTLEIIEALQVHRWIISNEEQDAHELFHVLTTTIEEELTHGEPVFSLLDAPKLEREAHCKGVAQSSKKVFVPSSKDSTLKSLPPSRGLLVSELSCKVCKSKYPARYDVFDSISLIIPTPHWGPLSLHDLLVKFISSESVQEVACDFCTKQNEIPDSPISKTTFAKQLSFGKLPKCLCIHIQRTMWLKNSLPVKCYDYILFPEVLAMDNYLHSHSIKKSVLNPNALKLTGGSSLKAERKENPVSHLLVNPKSCADTEPTSSFSSENSYVYLLKAVIVHLGDTSSGHFITYRRGSNTWFRTSDTSVKEVPFSEVAQSCAYMLFYERIQSD